MAIFCQFIKKSALLLINMYAMFILVNIYIAIKNGKKQINKS